MLRSFPGGKHDVPRGSLQLEDVEPGAIATFRPYSATALAEGTCRLLDRGRDGMDHAVSRLREKLSINRMLTRHLDIYGHLLKRRRQ